MTWTDRRGMTIKYGKARGRGRCWATADISGATVRCVRAGSFFPHRHEFDPAVHNKSSCPHYVLVNGVRHWCEIEQATSSGEGRNWKPGYHDVHTAVDIKWDTWSWDP